ncbi:MAG TPA: GC-type dockerin domain-anchored protein [Phycisphaerales bacterium]|nr:GC-type dockerin domain-anchored protein [Phycisphaerales bacterium]
MRITEAFAIAAVTGTAAAASAQTSYLSLWDSNFRYQVAQITPSGNGSRTNTTMGSGTQIFPTESWPTGYAPQTDPNNHTWVGNESPRWACTQHWWWYRGSGDTREYSVSNQTSYVQHSPGRLTMTYSEPVGGTANALLFTFVYTLTGEAAGPDTAVLTVDFTIQNTSASTLSATLFNFINLNAGGLQYPDGTPAHSDDPWSYQSFAGYSEYRVNQSVTTAAPFLTFGALGDATVQNDRWGGTGSSPAFSRVSFGNTTIQEMPRLNSESSPMSATGTEWSGGIQWTRSLEPGAVFSGTVYVGYNTTAPVTPPCLADLGQQGGIPGADGSLDNNDFVAFIDAFFAHGEPADLGSQGGIAGSDGAWDNNDFVVFIDLFFAGC